MYCGFINQRNVKRLYKEQKFQLVVSNPVKAEELFADGIQPVYLGRNPCFLAYFPEYRGFRSLAEFHTSSYNGVEINAAVLSDKYAASVGYHSADAQVEFALCSIECAVHGRLLCCVIYVGNYYSIFVASCQ